MLTFNKILNGFDQWQDVGPSYDDSSIMVYSGDLWKLAELFSGEMLDNGTLNRLHDIAEHYGVELRFYDETITDGQGRVHNTSPTHYGWTPTYRILGDCEVWAEDEIDSYSMIEEYGERLVDNMDNADQWGIDFSRVGFRKHEKQCESGFYHGQNDTPQGLWDEIQSIHGPCQVVFSIDETGQFDVRFSGWYRPTE